MRDVFDSSRAMSLSSVKMATFLLGALLAVASFLILLLGLGEIFAGRVFAGVLQIVASAALFAFCFLVVRLLGELLAALHRLNDRLTILGDDLRSQRATGAAQASQTED